MNRIKRKSFIFYIIEKLKIESYIEFKYKIKYKEYL